MQIYKSFALNGSQAHKDHLAQTIIPKKPSPAHTNQAYHIRPIPPNVKFAVPENDPRPDAHFFVKTRPAACHIPKRLRYWP